MTVYDQITIFYKKSKIFNFVLDRKIDFLIEKSISGLKTGKHLEKPGKIAKTQIYRGFLGRRHQAGGLLQ